ncbi:MAG: hypothetical protein AB7I24_05550 [Candidatus Nanopelagicales bacterium]
MTQPEPAETPDLSQLQLRIDVAIAQLIQPGTATIERDRLDESPAARELLADEAAEIADLRRRHNAHQKARRHAQASRTLAALIAAQRRAQAQHEARTARRSPLPSLLDQLLDAIPGSSNTDHGSASTGAHRAALALTVLDLIASMQRAAGNHDHTHLARDLRTWAARSAEWRVTNPTYLQHAATWAEQWVTTGRTLLDPPKRWSVAAACPHCGQHTAHVRDDSSEVVRRPALELDRTTGEARCLTHGCGARWAPEQLLFLARLLEQQRGGADNPQPELEMAG